MAADVERAGFMDKAEELKQGLARLGVEGTPALRAFAPWVLDNLALVAFHSIRGLAKQAGVNPNTVTRLARELGYAGFDALRTDVQAMLHTGEPTYGERARSLRTQSDGGAFSAMMAAHRQNTDALFAPETLAVLGDCVAPMLAARRIHTVGVRSCYSIAHYFSYVGGMAFSNFADVPSLPGGIVDQMSQVTADDIVVAITYAHYSSEVVRASEVARGNGARILALTDSHASPIAIGAWKVLRLPMAGPHFMPSLNSAFLAVEMLLVGMAAQSDGAAENVTAFEERIRKYGGYFGR
ncbi:MurR/RpiR family transcriptional regulator [Sulfitobacter sp. F26169L]|uniref:MurR/RpiR family transcriptional regulator n=1 Tax=Sulfitobacter sp. F26169L TaxID=2996015 RepID=UPI002260A0F6|nr:MurR/RpiR family transcriptional regulator [Sulfitobacter sp. F26169L]MCX7567898.1 MurR/RpiR family transcriptional regulator [Sulfitobacter sp. F26169L]